MEVAVLSLLASDKWEPGQGLVNQALAAALRHLLHDQFTLVAQLEHQLVNRGGLTLQKMWFYVQPALAYMETLASVVRTLRKVGHTRPWSRPYPSL